MTRMVEVQRGNGPESSMWICPLHTDLPPAINAVLGTKLPNRTL